MSYTQADFIRDLAVPRETAERVETHRRLLEEWSQKFDLVGPRELENYWRRHALDSGQLVRLAPAALRWIDLGAGAGFPGLIVAALIADRPGAHVDLVEATGKKAEFLETAAHAMGVPARVIHARIEDIGAGDRRYDVVTARALAPLKRLMTHAKPFLDRGAEGLFLKGAQAEAEMAAAGLGPHGGAFQAEAAESLSDPRGRIVRVRRKAR